MNKAKIATVILISIGSFLAILANIVIIVNHSKSALTLCSILHYISLLNILILLMMSFGITYSLLERSTIEENMMDIVYTLFFL